MNHRTLKPGTLRPAGLAAKGQRLILCAALLAAQLACGPARAKSYPNLKAQAERWAEAYVAEDYVRVASMTYPKQVELMGGPEGMAGILARSLEDGGVKILSLRVGEPEEAVTAGQRLFAVVPTLKMREPRGVVEGNSFLIGVSGDGGENWTFVDGAGGRTDVVLKSLLPEAAGKLKLPELKPLVLATEP
jgi:hypothetical protein